MLTVSESFECQLGPFPFKSSCRGKIGRGLPRLMLLSSREPGLDPLQAGGMRGERLEASRRHPQNVGTTKIKKQVYTRMYGVLLYTNRKGRFLPVCFFFFPPRPTPTLWWFLLVFPRRRPSWDTPRSLSRLSNGKLQNGMLTAVNLFASFEDEKLCPNQPIHLSLALGWSIFSQVFKG